MRLLLLLTPFLLASVAAAQSPLEATPSPFDVKLYETLTIRNVSTEPVVLDSLTMSSDDYVGWYLNYYAHFGGETTYGSVICDNIPDYYGCGGEGLFGSTMAPQDSLVIVHVMAYCPICLRDDRDGWGYDGVLRAYTDGDLVPLEVEILRAPALSAEEEAPVEPARLAVYPNPTRGAAALTVTLPAPGTFEVRVLDEAGRLVRPAVRHEFGVSEQHLPLGVDGLAAGRYHVEVRASDGSWRESRPLVVLD